MVPLYFCDYYFFYIKLNSKCQAIPSGNYGAKYYHVESEFVSMLAISQIKHSGVECVFIGILFSFIQAFGFEHRIKSLAKFSLEYTRLLVD